MPCCSDSDSDLDLPPLDELIARATPARPAGAKSRSTKTTKTAAFTNATPKPAARIFIDSPETSRKKQLLADELFPPSPPSTSVLPLPTERSTFSGASAGAAASSSHAPVPPTAPSPTNKNGKGKEIFDSHTTAVPRVVSVVTSDDEDDLAAISRLFNKPPQPKKVAPTPSPSHSTTQNPGGRLHSRSAPPQQFLVLSSDSEIESDTPPPSPPRKSAPRPRAQLTVETPRSAPARTMLSTPRVEVVSADDEDEAPVARVLPGGWPVDSDEDDWNAGVLSYVPTPRKTTPLASPARTKENATPLRANKKAPSSSMLDLTISSDSDAEPSRPSSLPLQPSTPSTPAPRPKATRKKAPTPAPAQSDSEPRLTAAQRDSLPGELIEQLNEAVFRREWRGATRLSTDKGRGPGLPVGLEVRWSNTLRNTAGRATWKAVKTASETTHVCHIDLATKVTDTPSKLLHTLSHELCHIAAWVLSNEVKPSHGPAFKLWSARIMSVRPDIHITTTHKYEIVYKWRWRCGECKVIFGRHSNSIDETKVGCGCGGRLVRIDKEGEVMGPRTPAKKSGWQEFLSTTMPTVRAQNPAMSQAEVMKAVAEKWNAVKLTQASPAKRSTSVGDVLADRLNLLTV